MWITWHQAVWLSIGCLAVTLATVNLPVAEPESTWLSMVRRMRAVCREVGIVAALYALWQWVFTLTVTKTAGAMSHARTIYEFEQAIGLPDELTVQHLSMRSVAMIEFLNQYYAYVHIPAMGAMIIWLFFRHRGRYPQVRNVLAISTGACLAIQSIPVAPPRFLPDLGFVDTALLHGQSVYGSGGSGLSNQLAAMPSVHIDWAVLVAIAVITASPSRWRWLVIAHPVVTLWAVVATGNHWWADGIVAIALLAASYALLGLLALLRRRLHPGAPEPGHRSDDRALAGTAPPTT